MFKVVWNALLVSPAIVGATLAVAVAAIAAETSVAPTSVLSTSVLSTSTIKAQAGDAVTPVAVVAPFNVTSAPAKVNAYGVSAVFRFSPKLAINGFSSYLSADFVNDGFGDRDLWTYGIGVSLADFGKKGNLLDFVAGALPYLGNPTSVQRAGGANNDTPIHLEAFYKYQLD